jgi:hypothetical protein
MPFKAGVHISMMYRASGEKSGEEMALKIFTGAKAFP